MQPSMDAGRLKDKYKYKTLSRMNGSDWDISHLHLGAGDHILCGSFLMLKNLCQNDVPIVIVFPSPDHCSYSRNSPVEIGTEVSDTFDFN